MTHHTKRKRTYKRAQTRTIVVKQSVPAEIPTPPTKIIVRYVSVSVQTDDVKLVQTRKKAFNMPHLESINRITNLPIVETGFTYADNIYQRIKNSNSLINWTFAHAENTFFTVVDTAVPAIVLFQGPLSQVDRIVCKTLDIVEEKIPSINLPPEMIYWNTKQYAKNTVSTKIVTPVLKRADSVKQIGNTVLASKYTAFAAETLDGALNVADKYVDKYLPADEPDASYDDVNKTVDGPVGKAIHTIQHVDRLGRKLKRRLTKRTLAEVKALKEQSAEAVHVLIYVAELIATDPVQAFQKGKELWGSLSKDEPENQARPENLEQLLVLLTRESARRVVHLVNFTTSVVHKINKNVYHSVFALVNKFLGAADSVAKDNWAQQLADPNEPHKTVLSVPQIKIQQLKAFHTNAIRNKNGFEHSTATNSA